MGGVSSENILVLADAASGAKGDAPKTDGPQIIDGVLTIKNLPVIQEKMPKKKEEELPPASPPPASPPAEEAPVESEAIIIIPEPTPEMLEAFEEEAQKKAEDALRNVSDE